MVEIVMCERGWVTLSANVRGKGSSNNDFYASEKFSPWAMKWRCLRDHTFSRFDTILACDRQTHRHTHRHTMMAITRASLAPRG